MTSTPSSTASGSFTLGGDLTVRRIGLGAMRLTDATGDGTAAGAQMWRAPADSSEAIALLRRAVDLGVQLIDTADSYGLGDNETLIAQALHPYPEDVVIATKAGRTRTSPGEWYTLCDPSYLKQQAELSLRRLRLETLDLMQLHRLDDRFPIAEQVGALAELRQEGKIRHIGLSEVTVDQLREAQRTAPIVSVQNRYNLTDRVHEPVLEHTRDESIAFIPFAPVAKAEHARRSGVIAEVAAEVGASPAQTALAWMLRHSPNILPIPGTTVVGHLEENVAAAAVTLTDEQYARLDALNGV